MLLIEDLVKNCLDKVDIKCILKVIFRIDTMMKIVNFKILSYFLSLERNKVSKESSSAL